MGGMGAVLRNFHPRELWTGATQDSPEWRTVRETAEGLHAQATTTGAQRLARLLITLAHRHGQPIEPQATGPERVITLPLSQEELADLALASRATATRALADWRKRNLVQTGHRRITVIDPAALRRLGGLGP